MHLAAPSPESVVAERCMEVGGGGSREQKREEPGVDESLLLTNRYHGICLYYAVWWEGKTVKKNVGRSFWQTKPVRCLRLIFY
jgi:hypothetical protein